MTDATSLRLRKSLGKFATGVTVITCRARDGRACGITANSFTSVSLHPPLILWNIAKTCNSLGAYLEAEHFAIHVLTAEQVHLANHFAQKDHKSYDDVGDHHIIVGEVLHHEHAGGSPLLFFSGNYASID